MVSGALGVDAQSEVEARLAVECYVIRWQSGSQVIAVISGVLISLWCLVVIKTCHHLNALALLFQCGFEALPAPHSDDSQPCNDGDTKANCERRYVAEREEPY